MPSRSAFAGFGLIAILVVLAIILILYFGVGGNGGIAQQAAQTRSTAREMAVELNTTQLTLLMVTYHQSNGGKLPATFEEMEAPSQSYTDPWGNPLTFKINKDARTGRMSVTYTSAGTDGEVGTTDDITKTDDLPV